MATSSTSSTSSTTSIVPTPAPAPAATSSTSSTSSSTSVTSSLASVAGLTSQLSSIIYNPASIQQAVMQTLTDVSNGTLTVVDPTNPFVFCLESAAVLTSYAVSQNEVLNRKQYPYAAQTLEDLYLHMSDTDYINQFAVPATDTFYMMFPYQELLSKLVLNPTTGNSQITIPRNTNITVANTVWSIQYPIIISQLLHGGMQVVYDTTELSPLQTLTTNVIPWSIVSDGTTEYLQISFEVMQFGITSIQQAVNASVLFQYQIAYTDQFYYARVYSQNSDGTWTEITTTHTPEIYDITTPTAVLQVLDNNILQVTIPQIYTATGTLDSTIRIDIYTTQGAINMALDNYSMGLFSIEFISYDVNDDTVYTAPLSTFTSVFSWSTDTVAGGSNGITFAQLQQEVINNAVGPQNTPISNVQLQDALATQGYQIVTSIDNVTDRVFLATRPMPTPVNSNLITAAGTTNATVAFSLDQIAGYSYAIDNTATTNSITLTPDALFQDVSGVVSFVPDTEITTIMNLPPDQLATVVTNGGYRYTPFHYVLDSSNNGFAVRPYYLSSPTILTKLFVSTNDTTMLQVNTGAYGIVTTATGFAIQIQTVSGASFQALPNDEVFVQLAFTPEGEITESYVNGTFVGNDSTGLERIYQFDLSTNFNVDADNNLDLTKFQMFANDTRLMGAPLTTTFDVLYATTATMPSGWVSAPVDAKLGRFLLPVNVCGITNEQLQVQFGYNLNTLWAQARSVISTITYQTYTTNIPALYPENVYEADPVTGSILTFVDGQPTYTLLHPAGAPVVDNNGNPVYLHSIGDPVLDALGNPIPANTRGMTRQIDFALIEGVYKFATDASSAAYRQQMVNTLITWLTQQLETMNAELLEQTELYFYPQQTLGQITVMVGASQETTIEAGQVLQLTLYVPSTTYNNADLCDSLETTSIQIISTALQATQISRSAIVDQLMTAYGSDVIDAELTGLGGAALNLPLFTILDNSIQPSLSKMLVAQTDNSLIVQENLTVNFVQHDVTALTT
jgi:hypothetical protein